MYRGLNDKLLKVNQSFDVVECRGCKLAFTNPLPCDNMGILYPKKYLSDRKEIKGFDMEKWYREDRYAYDFKLVKKATSLDISNYDSYLDVGCGTGEQMMFVKKMGAGKCWGIDKFDHLKVKDRNILNLAVEDFKPKKKFQMVSLFAVLEHVVDPLNVLKHIRENVVRDDGFLIISVPNYGSIERKVFGKKWYCLDVPRHLWHFNQRSVDELLRKSGFETVEIFKKNAWLHPVSIAPSLVADADMGKVWGEPGKRSHLYWVAMKLLWVILTLFSMPINWLLSLINQGSTMLIVAKIKK